MEYSRYVLCRAIPAADENGNVLSIEAEIAAREMDKLLSLVSAEHFPDPTADDPHRPPYRTLFRILEDWYLTTGTVPDAEIFGALAEKRGEDRAPALKSVYGDLSGLETDDGKWRFCLDELRDSYDTERLNEILVEAARINLKGVEEKKGAEDAVEYLYSRISVIERGADQQLETDARDASDLKEAYLKAEESGGEGNLIPTGYSYYDQMTGGGRKSEVWTWLAYTGEGKSMQMVNLAVNAVAGQSRNVVYATGEMSVDDIKRRVYACHSNNPRFKRERGLRTKQIELGCLKGEDREFLFDGVIPDFEENPEYGQFRIFTLPPGSTVSSVYTRVKRYAAEFPVDVLYLDYLALVGSDRRRRDDREEIDDKMKGLKQMALNFGDGEGLWVVTASQPSLKEYNKAVEQGYYDLTGFRGSGEIAFSSDVCAYILQTPECKQSNQLLVAVSKNRRGEKDGENPVRFYCDWGSAYIGEMAA